MVGCRSKRFLKIAYDCVQLPVLPYWHPLSELYLKECHEKGHGGLDSMVKQSRAKVWILHTRKKARKVLDHCFTCMYLAKQCGEQDGTIAAILFHSGGSVWANQFCGSEQQAEDRKGVGSCLCLHPS